MRSHEPQCSCDAVRSPAHPPADAAGGDTTGARRTAGIGDPHAKGVARASATAKTCREGVTRATIRLRRSLVTVVLRPSSRRFGVVSPGAYIVGSGLVQVQALDREEAQATGSLCGKSGSRDVVDASVELLARRRGAAVVTSDPVDLRRIDPSLDLVVC